ncbi:MAG: flavin reductase family protein [Sneathiellaceae bacterium]
MDPDTRMDTEAAGPPGIPSWDVAGSAAPDAFRRMMRRVVGGVSVVATRNDGRGWGMTVNAFTAVSMDPPTLLVCINARTVTAADIVRDRRFSLNLLSQDQLHLCRFCARPGEAKHLDGYEVPAAGLPDGIVMPVLPGSLATFDCSLVEARPVASHFVVIGTVEAIVAPPPRPPLLYGEGRYQYGVALEDSPAMAGAQRWL